MYEHSNRLIIFLAAETWTHVLHARDQPGRREEGEECYLKWRRFRSRWWSWCRVSRLWWWLRSPVVLLFFFFFPVAETPLFLPSSSSVPPCCLLPLFFVPPVNCVLSSLRLLRGGAAGDSGAAGGGEEEDGWWYTEDAAFFSPSVSCLCFPLAVSVSPTSSSSFSLSRPLSAPFIPVFRFLPFLFLCFPTLRSFIFVFLPPSPLSLSLSLFLVFFSAFYSQNCMRLFSFILNTFSNGPITEAIKQSAAFSSCGSCLLKRLL